MSARNCRGIAANAGAVGNTNEQYERKSNDIMRTYRQSWASSPNFRQATGAPMPPLSSSATDSVLFTKQWLESMADRSKSQPGCMGSIERVYPSILVGLGGFVAGLVDQNNLEKFKFQWAEARAPGKKRRAISMYFGTAMGKAVACGLVDKLAWPMVDLVVDYAVKHDCVKHLFDRGCLASATPLVSVTVVKLLLDTALWMRGWTSKNPLGKKNLTMTAVTIGLAAALAPVMTGPLSAFVMLVAGQLVISYMDALTTEWTTKNEWLYQTIGRQLYTLTLWIRGKLPNEHRAWSVPETLDVPSNMMCTISHELFMEPVLLHDMAFEKRVVMRWICETGRHPLNAHMQVSVSELMPAPELRALCHEFAAQHNLGLAP